MTTRWCCPRFAAAFVADTTPSRVLGGVEALARLAEDPDFDSIVCDLMMPEVDGKSFYDSIQGDHPQLADRIVFMSGGAFTPRLRRFAAAVPNPVLQKPVMPRGPRADVVGAPPRRRPTLSRS